MGLSFVRAEHFKMAALTLFDNYIKKSVYASTEKHLF